MAGKIPDETLQAIRERVSIVEIVSGYVSLKKTGRNYVGLCPFHGEKTPSFTVSEERGLFHCFGCGASGTVFTFLMRSEHVDFREAVEVLARRAGVRLPERTQSGPNGEQRQELIQVNELAQRYFRQALQSAPGAPARQYLERRDVSAAIAERYGLGFCPSAGCGLARGLPPKFHQRAIDLGLLGRRTDGGLYERMRGRVTFPIRDGSGRVIGFGGRTLGSEHPKYLNSPESSLFHKGQVLYGLYEARHAIQEAERVVIVEGYLDALALVQAGIECTVAGLGTALGAAQLRLARRFAPKVVVFFDGDRAGQEAATRAFAVCVEAGVWGLGAFLPNGMDPDDYVRQKGTAATRELLDKATPLADFFIDRLAPGPDSGLPERARAAEKIGQVISRVRDPFHFNLLAKQTAERLGVDESLFRELRTGRGADEPLKGASTPKTVAVSFRPEEATLIEAVALDCEVARLVSECGVLDAFSDSQLANAGRALIAAWERDHESTGAIDQLPPVIARRVAAGLLGEGAIATGDRLQAAQDCIDRIERRLRRSEGRQVLAMLRQAEASGDDRRYREALARKNQLLRRKEIADV